jgi:GTP-binding protein
MTKSSRSRLGLVYLGSAAGLSDCLRPEAPEIAVVGRSNAGKSSLLNALGGDRSLARVSKTPGRTQRLHFFDCPALGIRIVDHPGYGWARASREKRESWGRGIEEYLVGREALAGIILLLDVRREPEADEHAVAEFTARRDLRLVRVATKVDKLGRGDRTRCLQRLERAMPGGWIPFSATTGEGREALVDALARRPEIG